MIKNKKLLIFSVAASIIFGFLPNVGLIIEEGPFNYYYFGFPAVAFSYMGHGLFTFQILGILFNILIVYYLSLFVVKISNNIFLNKNQKTE
ncbi:hypothetical protein [Alkalihalobacillus trypoxylicola]|uniref:Uncharacterized protein n=1 Tax=Alkalihalobacillus trypoxylicola TaxID=519424 RepID=A0A161P5S4_9BACI|nr:hypothetical protein [Alkalihalobacillus trypoxylicola]KYG25563.1 hypothetical protein AZF04_13825 [Alkalihalobacillus trypoxylicola]